MGGREEKERERERERGGKERRESEGENFTICPTLEDISQYKS